MLLPFFGLRRGNSGKPVRHQMIPFQVEMWMWSVRQRWSCIKIPRKGPTVTYYFFRQGFDFGDGTLTSLIFHDHVTIFLYFSWVAGGWCF